MQMAIISGSARPQRQSHKVAVEIERRLKKLEGIEPLLLDVREQPLPLLDYTFKTHPSPSDALKSWQEKIAGASAYIIVSPEHNSSFAGALKNTMDYFYEEYFGKPMAIVTASAGILGGINAAMALQHYCLRLKAILMPDFLITPRVQTLFNAEGGLIDEKYGQRLESFLFEFLQFSQKNRTAKNL